MKILLISYYFKPFPGVGTKRALYWYEEISKKHDVDVLTAIEQEDSDSKILYLPISEKTYYFSKIIKDEGVKWLHSLKLFFKKNITQYNSIIITGGPFMHMLITKYLKRHTNSNIILDFRDPFYANPRFNTHFIKDKIKLYFQNKFIRYADEVITVNKYCAENIHFKDVKIIDNGYNEQISKLIKEVSINPKKIISIGRIDDDFNISIFNKILNDEIGFSFTYFGLDVNKINSGNSKHVISNPLTYELVLKEIKSSEICVLFTSGHPFESTTKIFDYLAFNKKILIITEGKLKTGSLNDITKDYPNIHWSENNEKSIIKNLLYLMNSETITYNVEKYSRKYGLQKLIEIIEK